MEHLNLEKSLSELNELSSSQIEALRFIKTFFEMTTQNNLLN